MNEEKRRSARTQSRFASDKDAAPSRREKEKQKGQKKGSKSGEKAKNEPSVSKMAAEGVSVEYQENSNYSFKELEKKKKPEELRFQGLHELSTTENGVSKLIYDAEFLPEQQADELMKVLSDTTKWHDKNIVIRGEEYPQPRLVAWYGPFPYTYSGATLEAAEMPQTVLEIKQRAEMFLKENGIDVDLNSVLLNLYRNEKDSVAWHSDDELTMGVCPTIASVSLGSVRKFEMRPKAHTIQQSETFDEESVFYVNLSKGSLIIMDGCMQKDWQHRVPKEYHDKLPRINLTFRTVYPIDQLPAELSYSGVENFNKASNAKKCPEEARFDAESFPPLVPTNQKNKTFTNSKASCDNVSPHPKISPNGLEANSTEHAVDENENQNNLNKDLDCFTSEDSSHYNVMEPEKSSDKLTASNEFEYDVSKNSSPQNISSSKKACLEDDAQKCEPAVENGKRQKSQRQSGNRHRFNINAPDFVPKNINIASPTEVASQPIYARYSLHDLAQYYESMGEMSYEELQKFSEIFFEKVEDSGSFFSVRDHHELRTLHALNAGGQTQDNRIVILNRICSIIQKCEYEKSRYSSPTRYGNRTGYGGDNYRSRNFSRTSYQR